MKLGLFVAVFIVYASSRNIIQTDSYWSVPTAISLLREGNTDLDEYSHLMTDDDYRLEKVRGHIYSIFPIGPSLVSLPFIWLLDIGLTKLFPMDLEAIVKSGWYTGHIELVIASLVVALCAVVLMDIALLISRDWLVASVTGLTFSFATPAWSTASRALWQHGPSILMLLISLYLILRAEDDSRFASVAAIPLAFSYVVRPTNAISIALLAAWIAWRYRSRAIPFLAILSSLLLAFAVYNFAVYGTALSPYYLASRLGTLNGSYTYVLAANLFSPGRGLFFATPILVFSLLGYLKKKKGYLDYTLVGIVTLHWLAVSSFGYWVGGMQFGPRLMSDLLPYFMYFFVFGLMEFRKSEGIGRWVFLLLFASAFSLSSFIHYRGANAPQTLEWNTSPTDIGESKYRVWDLTDIQFLRGLGGK